MRPSPLFEHVKDPGYSCLDVVALALLGRWPLLSPEYSVTAESTTAFRSLSKDCQRIPIRHIAVFHFASLSSRVPQRGTLGETKA